MTVTFEEQGDQTPISLNSLFESEQDLQQAIKTFKADEGMKQNVERMEKYLNQLN